MTRYERTQSEVITLEEQMTETTRQNVWDRDQYFMRPRPRPKKWPRGHAGLLTLLRIRPNWNSSTCIVGIADAEHTLTEFDRRLIDGQKTATRRHEHTTTTGRLYLIAAGTPVSTLRGRRRRPRRYRVVCDDGWRERQAPGAVQIAASGVFSCRHRGWLVARPRPGFRRCQCRLPSLSVGTVRRSEDAVGRIGERNGATTSRSAGVVGEQFVVLGGRHLGRRALVFTERVSERHRRPEMKSAAERRGRCWPLTDAAIHYQCCRWAAFNRHSTTTVDCSMITSVACHPASGGSRSSLASSRRREAVVRTEILWDGAVRCPSRWGWSPIASRVGSFSRLQALSAGQTQMIVGVQPRVRRTVERTRPVLRYSSHYHRRYKADPSRVRRTVAAKVYYRTRSVLRYRSHYQRSGKKDQSDHQSIVHYPPWFRRTTANATKKQRNRRKVRYSSHYHRQCKADPSSKYSPQDTKSSTYCEQTPSQNFTTAKVQSTVSTTRADRARWSSVTLGREWVSAAVTTWMWCNADGEQWSRWLPCTGWPSTAPLILILSPSVYTYTPHCL